MRVSATNVRYRRIVEAYLDTVWRVARRSGVEDAQLDDVIQEVFLVVARRLADIEPERERAFVVGVTTRVAANWRRSQRRRREDPVDDLEDLPVWEEESCTAAVERREGSELLRRSLALMTEAQRQVFVLAELEELTAAEIATELDLEEACVVSRLRRSRQVFRRFCSELCGASNSTEPRRRLGGTQ